jgi:hypothetical protein
MYRITDSFRIQVGACIRSHPGAQMHGVAENGGEKYPGLRRKAPGAAANSPAAAANSDLPAGFPASTGASRLKT